jgi:hypothetical protein
MDPILRHHFENIASGATVVNEDGSTSTVYTEQIDVDGRPTLIPRVWDGKILSAPEAKRRAMEKAKREGFRWPTADSHDSLRQHDIRLHKQMRPISAREARQILGQPAVTFD